MRRDFSAALVIGAGIALAAPYAHEDPHVLRARNIVDEIKDSYDFVVVGGGLAGLVLGGRLSEDSNHTVLVLEAGGTGDDLRQRIDTPGLTYYNSLWPTDLNWNFKTTAQPGAGGRELVWPRGKTLGGSAAINGLYMNRPGQLEIDTWKELLGDMDGADNWSWDSFFAAMKKSETFTPPSQEVAQEAGITWDPASHGTDGPIHYSWPGYTFPQVGQWAQAWKTLNLENSKDTYGGKNWGGYVATSSINPTNWTRSYSKSGYLDPLPPRSNYDVLANAQVTRLLFDSSSPKNNLTANQVEYTRDGGKTKLTVKVNKEVILAGGSVGSPAVLMWSGVGPKDVLTAAGVPVLSELPGVGQHLQDHVSLSLQWSTDQATAGSVYASDGPEKNDPAFLSYVNSATGYVSAGTLFDSVSEFTTRVAAQADQYAPKTTDANVLAGYKAIYDATINKIIPSSIGQIELLLATNSPNAIRITAALQHPLSHGSITIKSADPMEYPVIDPNYLANPADTALLREGLKLARRIGEADPLKNSMTGETAPGPDTQSDQQWEDWLKTQIGTEFHPSSSCAMLPLNQGGVVDAHLKVYGLSNVRVADASVPPIVFSAHLMASTYGLAEQASTIIRSFYNGQGSTGNGGNGGNGNGNNNGGNGGKGAAASLRQPATLAVVLLAAFVSKTLLL